MLTEAERQQLLVDWNDTARDYPRNRCIHHRFETQVAQTPDAVAVVFESQHLTYAQLNARANQLARHLQTLGVGPEVLVGLCVERSLEMVVGLLGILKAGGAYVPLDPTYPVDRLAFMIDDTRTPVLVTQSRLVNALPTSPARVVCLDANSDEIDRHDSSNPASGVTSQNLAYVIYTSGSTGKPKGVEVIHRGVLRLVCNSDYADLLANQVYLQLSPISFDASTFEIWAPLLNGARCVVFPNRIPTPTELKAVISNSNVTTLWLTASLYNLVIEQQPEALFSLEQLLIGGEALSVMHVRKGLEQLSRTQIINGYGPTENTTFTCCHRISRNLDTELLSIPIGRPIANTQVYILDDQRQPVPIGVAGELYIGGDGLARGYLNRPELTAERFVPNPFGPPDSRLYRTGDLVRYRPDGNIEYLGRLDHQVKIRGYRIELGEIESRLTQHPAIAQAVVTAREDVPGDKRLVTYCVPADPAIPPPSPDELRAFLRTTLPDYMIPAAFVTLPTLPLTPNGKIDRKALPAPDSDRPRGLPEYVAPRNPTEELLAGIWQLVLGLEQISVHDNFFDLGGHSLLATQVVSRIGEAIQVDVPLRDLFEFPTIATLAERLPIEGSQPPAPVPAPVPRDQPLPLSFAQQRLWFLHQYETDRAVYNVPYAVHFEGPLRPDVLQQCLQQIVQRHEVLRTVIRMTAGQAVQIIGPETLPDLPLVALTELPEAPQESRIPSLMTEEARRPFDLAGGPVLRAMLLRLGPERNILLLTIHHIACDGWSMGIVLDELKAFYRALSEGGPPDLPALPVQYADYAAWQREWLQGPVLQNQLEYWRRRLAGAPGLLELPTDHPRPTLQSYHGAQLPFRLPVGLSQDLQTLARRENVTLFMTLLSAWKILLHRHSRQDDIVVGSPVAGRNRSEFEHLIGFFVNTLVLRTDLSGNPTVRELLGRVRETALGAYTHQDLPFEKLVEELKPARSLAYSPLFQVMLVLQNAPSSRQQVPDLAVHGEAVPTGTSKFDLTLSLADTGDGLTGTLEYNTDLFEAATIQRMLGHFEQLLQGMTADPEQRIGELPMLTEAERQQLLVDWNDTARDHPRDQCIHHAFETQVAQTPDAVAVVFESQHLTYAQLNARANQLARHLQSLGVGPEVLVGLCLERSLDMVVGLLGILKAGGAYVPLDPTYPVDRLAFMIDDTRTPVLVTQSRLVNALPTSPARVVCLDADRDEIGRHDSSNPASGVTSQNLAYVIYTSGSTGKPKGVQIQHGSLGNLVDYQIHRLGISARDRVLQFASWSFDASVGEIFMSLCSGAALQIPLSEKLLAGSSLSRFLDEKGITIAKITPSVLATLSLDAKIPNLHTLISAGEHCPPQLIEHWSDGRRFINAYGPTEVTVWSTLGECEAVGGSHIGRPIANARTYILDDQRQPVPVGVPGELYIGGDGLARGYLNRPELTAERFVPNPFGPPGSRLYRTGDLVRYRPDGNIEYLGRLDHQVKIRGYRIELGEIESRLTQHPAIAQAVGTAREDVPGDKRLVAYCVPADPAIPPPSPDELRVFLRTTLPDYMIPAAFVTLPTLPLTPNGKIDRKALPAPDRARPQLPHEYVAPRNPTEELLAGIWRSVLGLEQISIHDNFFDLGGHSLLAVQLSARIEESLAVVLPLATIFQSPTVAELAIALDECQNTGEAASLIPLQPFGSRPPIFLLPGIGGHVLGLRDLAQLMDVNQPVFGLQPRGIDGRFPPHRRIEEMAAYLIEIMRQAVPSGPYYLAGFSAGGVVAYEMACQLIRSGFHVGLLAILDASAPGYPRKAPLVVRLGLHTREIMARRPREAMKYFANRIRAIGRRLHLSKTAPPLYLPPERASLTNAIAKVATAWKEAIICYKPKPVLVRITLLSAADKPKWIGTIYDDPTMGWGQLAIGGVEIRDVPGDHLQIVRPPGVVALAAELNACAAKAQTHTKVG